MLANLKEVLNYAEEHNCAIGAFNTPTMQNVIGIIKNAEILNVPVIISHAQCHENESPIDYIGEVMVALAKKSKVKVCVFLDHGEDINYIKRALEIGFTSVMFDGSRLPYDENVRITRDVVALAKKYGACVEAEIGALATREGGDCGGAAVYTEPADALKFVNDTGIDALACSFGTAHGIYKVKPKLDFDRIDKIHKLINIPLVMHGGSGLSNEEYQKAMTLGVKKINAYSYVGRAGVLAAKEAIESERFTYFHELSYYATNKMSEYAMELMKVFYKNN